MKTLFISLLMACGVLGYKSPRPPGYDVFTPNFKSLSFVQEGDIVEGDIRLDKKTAAFYRGEARNAMKNVNLWKNGVVPYILDASVDDHLKSQIEEGIEHYHKYTCLRFVQRTNQRDYIRVMKPASGCNSMVGAIGGEQILNMGDGCQYVGLVLHEFGHAIGYFHEHNRPDRDDVVDIKWDNIQFGFKDAFYKYTFDEADVQGFPYDLTSIMHYENTAFTNGYCRPTMLVKKDPSYEVTPVYLREFSPQDIEKINKLYSCQTNQLPPTVLPGSGNPDPSQCKCEDKYDQCQNWKNSGECGLNLMWMSTNCPKSCRTCGEPPSDCQDLYPVACEGWGQGGECSRNPIWMNAHCERTCQQCSGPTPIPGGTTQPPVCKDFHAECQNWKEAGECGLNLVWMSTNCAKSCRTCGEPPSDCQDLYPVACEDWGQAGECSKNPGWMNENCEKTCQQCSGPTQPPLPSTPQTPPPPATTANPPQPTTQSPDCKDVYPEYCPDYKNDGMCRTHEDYMKEVCPKTCGFCGGPTQPPLPSTPQTPPPPTTTAKPSQPTTQSPDCKDVYPEYCPDYKNRGMCRTHEDYMKEVCPKTCGFCGGSAGNCEDVYPEYCPGYKQNGMCTDPDYLDYVKEVCKFTCGFCMLI